MFCEIYDSVVFDGAHQEDKKDLKAWGDSITLGLKTLEKMQRLPFCISQKSQYDHTEMRQLRLFK